MYVLAIDLGSTSLRCTLHPQERPWEVIDGAVRRYRVFTPRNPDALSTRFVEDELWARLASAIREALGRANAEPASVSMVSITAQRGGTAFIDGDGKALYLAPNTDLRAVFEGASIEERLGANLYQKTGHSPPLFFVPAKLAWWRGHHPRIARRIASVATLASWAAYRLTGALATTSTELSEAGLLDAATRSVDTGLLDALEVAPSLVPPLVDEGEAMGAVRAAAGDTGLVPGTPVAIAGPDTHTALVGMGAATEGDVGIVAGWSVPTQVVTAAPVFDAERRTWTGPHIFAERGYVEASAGDAGGTLEMVRRLLGSRAGGDRLDALVSQSRAGSNLITAFWGPRALDLSNPGISLGGLLAPAPITYNPVRAAFVARATLENIAFAVRECAALATEVAGVGAPRSIALGGGMAASNLFPQMLADVLNAPVRRHLPQTSAIGAAMVAGGARTDWHDLARSAARHATTIEPDVRGVIDYEEAFGRWQRLKARLDELTNEL